MTLINKTTATTIADTLAHVTSGADVASAANSFSNDQAFAAAVASANAMQGLASFTKVASSSNVVAPLAAELGTALNDFLKDVGDDFLDFALNLSDTLNNLGDAINDLFQSARNWVSPYRAPLMLGLDGDGIETVGIDGGVLFDHLGDGVRRGTGWVFPDEPRWAA